MGNTQNLSSLKIVKNGTYENRVFDLSDWVGLQLAIAGRDLGQTS